MKQKYCIFARNTIFMLTNAISNVSPDNFIAIDYHVNAVKEKKIIFKMLLRILKDLYLLSLLKYENNPSIFLILFNFQFELNIHILSRFKLRVLIQFGAQQMNWAVILYTVCFRSYFFIIQYCSRPNCVQTAK